MGSETQREAAFNAWADSDAEWSVGNHNRRSFNAGWDARSAALPSREQIAEAIEVAQHPNHVSFVGADALDQWYLADVVLSLLSDVNGEDK